MITIARDLEVATGYAHEVGERAARHTLRAQIARLERDLSYAGGGVLGAPPASGGPRLLSIGELEQVRDALVDRLRAARAQAGAVADAQERKRLTLERMRLDPAAYKWARVTNADIGAGGCVSWDVRPRMGPIGLLLGWWRVKVSSGCPLAT